MNIFFADIEFLSVCVLPDNGWMEFFNNIYEWRHCRAFLFLSASRHGYIRAFFFQKMGNFSFERNISYVNYHFDFIRLSEWGSELQAELSKNMFGEFNEADSLKQRKLRLDELYKDTKRGSRGAARAAKSLRWSV